MSKKKHAHVRRVAKELEGDKSGEKVKVMFQAMKKLTASGQGQQGMGGRATLDFPVEGLKKEASSVEAVGELVSEFTYVNSKYKPGNEQFCKGFLGKVEARG